MYSKEQVEDAVQTVLFEQSDYNDTKCLRLVKEILKELENPKGN